ncbi:metal ABC transporter solute-binding protein, Zn/Mn family [Thermophagus sp. OGC60D27]|uniref:metal ABC transporter solute-binding protein, Zn/Mn family n=1 Tax=Thermophagus sp. OGC60D27 TaxID=3458415 RepID=UPI00403833B5
MDKKGTTIIQLVSIVFVILMVGGCHGTKNEKNGITVSIEPLKYLVDQLTSEQIEVNVMVPMGSSPATYAPTTRQLVKLSDSRLFIGIGHLGFEQAWMDKIVDQNPELKTLFLADGLDLIISSDEHHGDHVHEGGVDPHIWMSPKVVKSFLPALKDHLIQFFPEQKEVIEKAFPTLLARVSDFDRQFASLTDSLSQKKFMIFHPALSYLARDYGFEQISIEHEGKEPSPRQLQELISLAKAHNVRLIFIQAEFDRRNAAMVKEATGAELVSINPLNYDWFDSMSELKQLMQQHLK